MMQKRIGMVMMIVGLFLIIYGTIVPITLSVTSDTQLTFAVWSQDVQGEAVITINDLVVWQNPANTPQGQVFNLVISSYVNVGTNTITFSNPTTTTYNEFWDIEITQDGTVIFSNPLVINEQQYITSFNFEVAEPPTTEEPTTEPPTTEPPTTTPPTTAPPTEPPENPQTNLSWSFMAFGAVMSCGGGYLYITDKRKD